VVPVGEAVVFFFGVLGVEGNEGFKDDFVGGLPLIHSY
jgi:hypothetical protein